MHFVIQSRYVTALPRAQFEPYTSCLLLANVCKHWKTTCMHINVHIQHTTRNPHIKTIYAGTTAQWMNVLSQSQTTAWFKGAYIFATRVRWTKARLLQTNFWTWRCGFTTSIATVIFFFNWSGNSLWDIEFHIHTHIYKCMQKKTSAPNLVIYKTKHILER